MKETKGTRGAKAFLAVIAAIVVAGAISAVVIIHGMQPDTPAPVKTSVSPTPSEEEHVQPTAKVLPMPHYPSRSSCGRKGEANGLDPQNVLGFEGLCIPLVVPPAEYGKWGSGEEGDWVDGERGKVDFCDPARGCTSVALYTHGEGYIAHADCGDAPAYRNNVLVGGYAAVHVLIKRCGANLDQFQHVWVVETPNGSVAVVAESPEVMDMGKEDGSSTPARVGESMAIAKVFDDAA